MTFASDAQVLASLTIDILTTLEVSFTIVIFLRYRPLAFYKIFANYSGIKFYITGPRCSCKSGDESKS